MWSNAALEGVSLKLDAHIPEGTGPFPIVIIKHGGGNKDDKQSYVTPLFSPLSTASFTWFTIDYRPVKTGYAATIADVMKAIYWIKSNAAKCKGDKQWIALVGESSGGILTLVTAGRLLPEVQVQAIVAFYTPADIRYVLKDGNMSLLARIYWGV